MDLTINSGGVTSMRGIDSSPELQEQIVRKGEQIFSGMEASSGKSIFNKDWWYGRIMDWSMKNEHFKVQMFRFVDVLPYLHKSSEVAKHLKEYFAESGDELPSVFNFGLGMGTLAPGLLAGAVKKNVTQMAKMFITGETPKEALPVIKKARKQGLTFTVDLLGEATLSEKEALEYQERYLQLIQQLSEDAKNWPEDPLLDCDERGSAPKVNVSVKVTSLYSQINEAAWDHSIQVIKERLEPIFKCAMENSVFVNIDMEQYHHKDLTLQVFKELTSQPEFKEYPHWGIVIQAYLRDAEKDVRELVDFAAHRGTPFTVRLVKGAYWDYETIIADQHDWPIPVFTNKKESDACYERCVQILLEHYPHIRVAIGSHNVRSIAAAMVHAERLQVPKQAIEIQMLYGMAEPIKRAVVNMGYRVREYATVGELIPGMAYLVRRLLENTSNESFLRSKFAENIDSLKLLADPSENLEASSPQVKRTAGSFKNEPLLDFTQAEPRIKMAAALETVKANFGKDYPIVIDHEDMRTNRYWERHNPSNSRELLGRIHLTTTELADKAVESARQAYPSWSQTPAEKRARVLEALADLMVRDRYELMATEVYEVGKSWKEADGDITEAVDFCRYYARDIRRLDQQMKIGNVTGEVTKYHYQSRGVSLVIAPWNFPLAILTGMTAASIVCGNTAVVKPAEQSSITAWHMMRLLKEAGCPAGVVNFLPGLGEEVGEHLTGHRHIDMIAFTGSKEVGMKIIQKAGLPFSGQTRVKHCIIEMGGKNAIIIDSDADLDEAVAGVIYSAFGFQGQKCSACSRAIVHEGIYERFLERLVAAAESLPVKNSQDPHSFVGPVVDEEAKQKIIGIIERAASQYPVAFRGEAPAEGHFVAPTIFKDVDNKSELAQEEIFGPVLAVIKANDLDHALEMANDTIYGLTGGVYSRSPANIEKIRAEYNVGNLYINRGITGAMVDRHPFGGFKMSGLGSKTGGPDYLLQFMDPRCVTENTMRRGFAPTNEIS